MRADRQLSVPPLRAGAVLLVLCLLAAACGQKEGVHLASGRAGAAAGDLGGGALEGGVGDGADVAGGSFDDLGAPGDAGSTDEADLAPAGTSDFSVDASGGGGQVATGGSSALPPADGGSAQGGGAGSGSGGSTPAGGGTGAGGSGGGGAGGGGTGGGGAATAPSGGQQTGGGQTPAGGGSGGGQTPSGGAQQPAGQPPAGGAAAQPAGGGGPVVGPVIKIGFHAPLTGAAPLPQTSFEKGRYQYWGARGKIAGRTVEVVIRDDKYNPASATQVCNELIQKEKVFILVGGGGTDQIAACARVAAQAGVPYLSSGVTESPLNTLREYFALSMSYAQQAPLLVQWIMKNAKPQNGKVGVLRSDTPNFDDGINAFKRAAQQAGLQVVEQKLSKDPSPAELSAAAQRLLTEQIKVAYPLMAPADWIQVPRQPSARGIQWAGVGITMGLNTVATAACPDIDGAMFFSPWPGLNMADKLDPGFAKSGGGDDIQWSLWGSAKTLDQVFTKVGQNLTAETFMRTLESMVVRSGIYPELRHTPRSHFGISQVHVVRADCGARQFVSGEGDVFRSSF